jgi:hypothetical protein
MQDDYTLNVFSNVSEVDVKAIPVRETLASYLDVFGTGGLIQVNFFIHPLPFYRHADALVRYIESFFKGVLPYRVHMTHGLADGYTKSILICETEFCFQLEHDWLFEKSLIGHKIPEIIAVMSANGMEHVRFNKAQNIVRILDTELEEFTFGDLKLCRTPMRSNNPHLIPVQVYKEKYLHIIDPAAKKSKGVEEKLYGSPGSFIYGPKGYPPTVRHNDGRNRQRKLGKSLGKPTYNFLVNSGILQRVLEAEHAIKRRLTQ